MFARVRFEFWKWLMETAMVRMAMALNDVIDGKDYTVTHPDGSVEEVKGRDRMKA